MFFFWVFWIILAIMVGAFADSRGRSGFGYFLLSAVFSPLLGLIILLCTRDLAKEAGEAEYRRRQEENAANDRQREHEKQIEALKALSSPARAPAPAPTAHLTPAEEIEKLASLLERGLLTDQEFKDQKAAILARR